MQNTWLENRIHKWHYDHLESEGGGGSSVVVIAKTENGISASYNTLLSYVTNGIFPIIINDYEADNVLNKEVNILTQLAYAAGDGYYATFYSGTGGSINFRSDTSDGLLIYNA